MTPAEMIRAFYDGESVETIADTNELVPAMFEMLLRGYIIGLQARAAEGEDES